MPLSVLAVSKHNIIDLSENGESGIKPNAASSVYP
jgi:hypothetical protein